MGTVKVRAKADETLGVFQLGKDEDRMPELLTSEAIQPVVVTVDTACMAAGEPGLPQRFKWKRHDAQRRLCAAGRQTIRIVKVLKTWHETGPCQHGRGEAYVRKHWFQVETVSGPKIRYRW